MQPSPGDLIAWSPVRGCGRVRIDVVADCCHGLVAFTWHRWGEWLSLDEITWRLVET